MSLWHLRQESFLRWQALQVESTPTAPWRVSQSGSLVRHGRGAVAALGVALVAARGGHRAVWRRVLVVVADQALLHDRVRARPLRHGFAVRGGGVAALAEEAGLDEVLVVDDDAAAADVLEQVLVGVAAAARLVEHEAEDGLLVVARDLRDGLLQRLELGGEEEERTRLGVALLAVHAVVGRLPPLVDVGDVALAGPAEARRGRAGQGDPDEDHQDGEGDRRDGDAACREPEVQLADLRG